MVLEDKIKKSIAALGGALFLVASSDANAQQNPVGSDANVQQYPVGYFHDPDPSARTITFGTTIALNALICGTVGAAEGRNFWKDLGKGALAGALQATGNEIAMHDMPILPGIGFRTAETGVSVTQNILEGRGLFDKLGYSIGPLLIEFYTTDSRKAKEKFVNLRWRFAPVQGILYNIAKENEFSILDTLSYQIPSFRTESFREGLITMQQGLAIGNVINYDPKSPSYHSHEMDHAIWFEQGRIVQTLLEKDLPKETGWLNDYPHYSAGEDLTIFTFSLPQMICRAADGEACSRVYGGPLELRAFTNQTASGSKENTLDQSK